MRNRRLILTLSLFGLFLLVGLLYLKFDAVSEETETRQKLNELLGDPGTTVQSAPEASNNDLIPNMIPDSPSLPSPQKPQAGIPSPGELLFGMPMSTSDVGIEETSSNYVIRVPLASESDSSAIKLNVTPHQIEISGQTGSQDGGKSVQSSFFQTFTTTQEVLPEQVHRRTEKTGNQTELVITIPKKTGAKAQSIPEFPALDDDSPTKSNGAPSELRPPSSIPTDENGNPNSLDTFSNRTF